MCSWLSLWHHKILNSNVIIKYLQFTVSSRLFVPLLSKPLPTWHVNNPWSFFDSLVISRFDPSTTVPSCCIQWNWHGGLHWTEQTVGPRLCPRTFVIDSSVGFKEIFDPGPAKIQLKSEHTHADYSFDYYCYYYYYYHYYYY